MESDKRPVVLIDIKFNGKTIKDVEVNVRKTTEREKDKHNTDRKILLSTNVIEQLGLIVHPDRNTTFRLSNKSDIGKEHL